MHDLINKVLQYDDHNDGRRFTIDYLGSRHNGQKGVYAVSWLGSSIATFEHEPYDSNTAKDALHERLIAQAIKAVAAAELFASTALYVGPSGTYFDVIDALPDAPPGSVIVNVSGLLFGLEPNDLNLLLGMLGPDATHGRVTLQVKDPDGLLWLTATSDPHGLELVASFPACGANGRVLLPHDQADRVRAAIEEVTKG